MVRERPDAVGEELVGGEQVQEAVGVDRVEQDRLAPGGQRDQHDQQRRPQGHAARGGNGVHHKG